MPQGMSPLFDGLLRVVSAFTLIFTIPTLIQNDLSMPVDVKTENVTGTDQHIMCKKIATNIPYFISLIAKAYCAMAA